MKTNREQLLTILNSVKPGVAKKEVIEQSSSFVFTEGQVVSFNDEISVHHPLPDGLEELAGAVPANEFLAILSRFTGEEVELKMKDEEIRIKCGKGQAGVRLEAEITLPVDEIQIPDEWSALPDEFLEALVICGPSAARDLTYPILTNVYLTSDQVIASDNNVLAVWDWSKSTDCFGDDGLLLPVEAALALAKLPSQITDIAVDESWAHFRGENDVIFSCRISEGDYPDISPFLDVDEIGSVQFPNKLPEILDRAGVFLAAEKIDADRYVNIQIDKKGLMTVRGEGESGWYEERCRTKWNGGEFAFPIHPSCLQAVLKSSSDAVIGKDRIKFLAESFIHIVGLEAE